MNIKTTKSFHSPIFITGVPRSGTSMTAGISAELGVFTGATVPPGVSNPKGFFENVEIRESVLKGILKASHFCPLGVKSLPPEDFIGKFNFRDGKSLKDILRAILTNKGTWKVKHGYTKTQSYPLFGAFLISNSQMLYGLPSDAIVIMSFGHVSERTLWRGIVTMKNSGTIL